MEELYQKSGLVIARAGAGMVSELTALQIPTIFVPLPHGNGEQFGNAQTAVDSGGALRVADSDFTASYIKEHIFPLALEVDTLSKMSESLGGLAIWDGAKRLFEVVESLGL
jgi:UDP-N-acetylglucosamine:LPS N-acetylglucosamine transferase